VEKMGRDLWIIPAFNSVSGTKIHLDWERRRGIVTLVAGIIKIHKILPPLIWKR
jgi:hypothetical protein